MKNSTGTYKGTSWLFLLLFLSIESGCNYYKVVSSKPSGSAQAKENLDNSLKENKSIFIYSGSNFYRLSNLSYNPENSILSASAKIDSSSLRWYNPYFPSRKQKGERKLLSEVFIISDQVNFLQDTMVTIPLSSIIRIDKIKSDNSKAAGDIALILLTVAFTIPLLIVDIW